MKAWQVSELGDPWDVLEIADVPTPDPGDNGVLIRVEATDLNFADILQCQGSYQVRLPMPFTPGMTAAGTVLAAPASSSIQAGERLIAPVLGGAGGYAEEALINLDLVEPIPDGIDPIVAAAMHITYGTAWFALHHRGNLRPDETLLILAAAGGVGSAAIELAKLHGSRVLAAAGGPEKLAACEALGADAVIDYNREDLYQVVMELTEGKGADVVYDPVGGQYFDIARRLVAWEGRLLIIGFASGTIPQAPLNHALVKNYSIVGVHMGGYRSHDIPALNNCFATLNELLLEEKISPLVDEVVGFRDLPVSLKKLANRQTKGRVIFDPRR